MTGSRTRRWSHVSLDAGVITIGRATHVDHGQLGEKDTKTHQQRRVVLDADTVAILPEHRQRARERAALLGTTLGADVYVFTNDLLSQTPRRPDGVSQGYDRLAKSLKINTTLKDLRHYSATELINSGVDVRTAAVRRRGCSTRPVSSTACGTITWWRRSRTSLPP